MPVATLKTAQCLYVLDDVVDHGNCKGSITSKEHVLHDQKKRDRILYKVTTIFLPANESRPSSSTSPSTLARLDPI